jgi:hypothetical protein
MLISSLSKNDPSRSIDDIVRYISARKQVIEAEK